jgi:hypothetical protein
VVVVVVGVGEGGVAAAGSVVVGRPRKYIEKIYIYIYFSNKASVVIACINFTAGRACSNLLAWYMTNCYDQIPTSQNPTSILGNIF